MNKSNLLPGVPLVESPFFDQFFNEKNTPPVLLDIARQLRQNGFAVIDFPDQDFDQIADTIKADLTTYLTDKTIPRNSAQEDATRIQDAWRFNPLVKKLACNFELCALLSTLYGRLAWPFQTLNFRFGSQQNPHSDAVHFSSIPERFMCGVWVALEDIHLEAGPLCYYPGSHQWPIYENHHIGYRHTDDQQATNQSVYHALWEGLVKQHQVQPQQFVAKKGQALIWAANLLHGGLPRVNPALTRWSQVTHYYFDDCLYYTPMLSDPMGQKLRYRQPSHIGQIEDTQFNATAYLEKNPDVANAGVEPYWHYMMHGYREGRRLK